MSEYEKLQEKFRVRIIKKEPDARLSICGTSFIYPGQETHDGTEINGVKATYAVVPAHAAEHLKANNKHYVFSDPFIPEEKKK